MLLALFAILLASCASSPDSNGGMPATPAGASNGPGGDGPAEPVHVPSITDRPVRIEWVNLDPRRSDPPLGLINRTSPEVRELYRNSAAWAHVKPVDDDTMAALLGAFKQEGFYEHAEKGRGSESLKMGEGKGAICLLNGTEKWTLIFGPGMAATAIPDLYVKLKHNIIHVHRTTLHLAPSSPQDPNRVFRVPTRDLGR